MISKEMIKELNKQITAEFYSAYMYLSFSAYFSDQGYDGAASWFRYQAKEEQEHAMKIYDYLLVKGVCPELRDIQSTPIPEGSLRDIFEKALGHEKLVTKMIYNLMTLAKSENDYSTEIFLQWFVTEQVEEEETVRNILEKIDIANKNHGSGILTVDNYLGNRASA